MVEETIVDVERKLVGRVPFKYELSKNTRVLEADSGFGKLGAKMDPKTGALMYDRFEDWITKEKIIKEEVQRANIRFSQDSGALIQITEDENVLMGVDGAIKAHDVKGTISVYNRSDKDRVWDVDVGMEEHSGAAKIDFPSVNAKEIEPGKRVSRQYGIFLHEPSVALEEIISTHPDLSESRVLVKGRPSHAMFQLGLKNLAVIPYSTVAVSREMPAILKNVVFPESKEDVGIDQGKLNWKIKDLQPGEMRVLRYEGDLDAGAVDKVPVGDINLTARADDIITDLVVNSFEAMCRNMYFIEADETEEPGEWICRFVVENTSHFEVEIVRVEVQDPRTNQVFLNMESSGIYVPPKGRWESDTWLIRQSERPTFLKNLILNIVPGITKAVEFKLRRDGGSFYPAGISFRKTLDKAKVEARRDTEVNATIIVENTGICDIEQVFVRDTLPKYMMAPSQSTIVVEKGGIPLRDNVGVHIEGSGDGESEQQFYIRVDDLSQFGGPLKPGDKVLIKYKSIVHRPEPGERMVAPASVDARTLLPGPVLTGEDVAGAPVIDTMQILRRFSVGKSIEQGAVLGEYKVELLYRNRGNNPVVDLTLRDLIPENFKGKDFSASPSQEFTPEGITLLQWKVDKVLPGQSLVIAYTIRGEGEYHPRDAQIFYNA